MRYRATRRLLAKLASLMLLVTTTAYLWDDIPMAGCCGTAASGHTHRHAVNAADPVSHHHHATAATVVQARGATKTCDCGTICRHCGDYFSGHLLALSAVGAAHDMPVTGQHHAFAPVVSGEAAGKPLVPPPIT